MSPSASMVKLFWHGLGYTFVFTEESSFIDSPPVQVNLATHPEKLTYSLETKVKVNAPSGLVAVMLSGSSKPEKWPMSEELVERPS